MISQAEENWITNADKYPLPYMPYLPAGWDPRPWGDIRASFKLPNAQEWEDALCRMKTAMDKYKKLRLPDGTSEGQKIFSIYAWNEFGEGGIMAPCIGDGFMKLKKVKNIFVDDTK